MTDQEQLSPCPFCFTRNARAFHTESHDDWFVKCLDCDNSMPPTSRMVHSRDEAIAAWNGAAAHVRIAELERQLAEAQGTREQHLPDTLPLLAMMEPSQ